MIFLIFCIVEEKETTGNHTIKMSNEPESSRNMKPFVSLSIYFDFTEVALASKDINDLANEFKRDKSSHNDGMFI